MGEDTKENNVLDFVAYKLERMESDAAHEGRFDYALALHDALTAYLDGTISIMFSGGYPYSIHETDEVEAK